ncbi:MULTISPECIES: hypothetical protein [Bradyrhizobium]|uniref:hypothetical protein n=1 Tax=Bradyrhizobium TaxID=374 RepID=UPI000F9EA09C|nr:hypothetical protein [Bradyrhizobium denitrificans]MCL8487887.1 hypothetical protein [Bradyrhizobium denitrificans]RTL93919.1 MAG: hypothetical protein EKK32_28215 [Bradyrhizobiaceae bacterium]
MFVPHRCALCVQAATSQIDFERNFHIVPSGVQMNSANRSNIQFGLDSSFLREWAARKGIALLPMHRLFLPSRAFSPAAIQRLRLSPSNAPGLSIKEAHLAKTSSLHRTSTPPCCPEEAPVAFDHPPG